jgi:PAS domain-containing protein
MNSQNMYPSDFSSMSDAQFTASLDALVQEGLFHSTGSASGYPAALVGNPVAPASSQGASVGVSAAQVQSVGSNSNNNVQAPFAPFQSMYAETRAPTASFPSPSHTASPYAIGTMNASMARSPVASKPEVSVNTFAASAVKPPPMAGWISRDNSLQTSQVSRGRITGMNLVNRNDSTNSTPMTSTASMTSIKRKRYGDESDIVISEDEGDQDRRRHDRNWREQQRSQRITQQIITLKNILEGAQIEFKPDKYSTLVTVGDYIKTLQEQSAKLDQEHQKLLDTLTKTSEIVNSKYAPTKQESVDLMCDSLSPPEDEALTKIQGIDYESVFMSSPFPFAISSIDGRFIDCNDEFEALTGYKRDELLPLEFQAKEEEAVDIGGMTYDKDRPQRNLSIFNVLQRESMQKVFSAMSEMLKQPFVRDQIDDSLTDFWSQPVELCRNPSSKVCLWPWLW